MAFDRGAHASILTLCAALTLAGCSCLINPDETDLGPGSQQGDASPDGDATPDSDDDTGEGCGDEICNGVDDDCDETADEGFEFYCEPGRCTASCAAPGGTFDCVVGQCQLTCSPGFVDCDGDEANGCESEATVDSCPCGEPCADGLSCVAPGGDVAPTCTSECPAGFDECGGSCAELETDVRNCGECGNTCPAGPGLTATCSAGICGTGGCEGGTADCDGDLANGCEVTLGSAEACGGCGDVCAPVGTETVECRPAGCVILECPPFKADCDGERDDGCEIDLRVDGNCGECGRTCAAGQSCVDAMCQETACPDGFTTCLDGAPCETNIREDPNNCGGCGRTCEAPAGGEARCEMGDCVVSCTAPQISCPGGCTNPTTDNMNCGECGNACVGMERCTDGECIMPSVDGEDCDRRDSDSDGEVDEEHLMTVPSAGPVPVANNARGAFRVTTAGNAEYATVSSGGLAVWNGSWNSVPLPGGAGADSDSIDICGGAGGWYVPAIDGNSIQFAKLAGPAAMVTEIPLNFLGMGNAHLVRCAVIERGGRELVGITLGRTATFAQQLRIALIVVDGGSNTVVYSGYDSRRTGLDRYDELDIVGTRDGFFIGGLRSVFATPATVVERIAVNMDNPAIPSFNVGGDSSSARRAGISLAYMPRRDEVVMTHRWTRGRFGDDWQWFISRHDAGSPGGWPSNVSSDRMYGLFSDDDENAREAFIANADEGDANPAFGLVTFQQGSGYQLTRWRWAPSDPDPLQYDEQDARGGGRPSALIGAEWPSDDDLTRSVPNARYMIIRGEGTQVVGCN